VGFGEAGDPFGGGGEGDAVAGLAGPDAEADGEVGLAGAGRAQEDHVLFAGHEIEGAEVGDGVSLEGALVVEVEVLEGLAGGEPGGFDAALAAVVLAGGDFSFEAGGQELFVGPAFGSRPFPEPSDGRGQGRRFHGPTQIGQVGGGFGGGAGGHQATPLMRS
jgi:hypothetical protein